MRGTDFISCLLITVTVLIFTKVRKYFSALERGRKREIGKSTKERENVGHKKWPEVRTDFDPSSNQNFHFFSFSPFLTFLYPAFPLSHFLDDLRSLLNF